MAPSLATVALLLVCIALAASPSLADRNLTQDLIDVRVRYEQRIVEETWMHPCSLQVLAWFFKLQAQGIAQRESSGVLSAFRWELLQEQFREVNASLTDPYHRIMNDFVRDFSDLEEHIRKQRTCETTLYSIAPLFSDWRAWNWVHNILFTCKYPFYLLPVKLSLFVESFLSRDERIDNREMFTAQCNEQKDLARTQVCIVPRVWRSLEPSKSWWPNMVVYGDARRDLRIGGGVERVIRLCNWTELPPSRRVRSLFDAVPTLD